MVEKLNFSYPVDHEAVLRRSLNELDAVESGQIDSIEITTLKGLKRVTKCGASRAKADIQDMWGTRYPNIFE